MRTGEVPNQTQMQTEQKLESDSSANKRTDVPVKKVLITGGDTGLGLALQTEFLYNSRYLPFITVRQRKVEGSGEIVHSSLVQHLSDDKTIYDVVVLNHGINNRTLGRDEHFFHNLTYPVRVIEAVIDANRISQNGIICTVLSEAAWKPMTRSLAYNCSKAALMMATEEIARTCTKQGRNLTIFGVAPGRITGTYMTATIDRQIMLDNGWNEDTLRDYRKTRFLGHGHPAAKYARMIYDMLTSDGVEVMNGSIVPLCFRH